MLKHGKWRTHARMSLHTGHATFDSQCDGLTNGNVVGNVQRSSYVRAFRDTECNGLCWPEGRLRESDLKQFGHIPRHVLDAVGKETVDRRLILYKFRHWKRVHGGKREVVHGWVLVRDETGHHSLIRAFYTGPTWKSRGVIDECVKYITGEDTVVTGHIVKTAVAEIVGDALSA